MQDSGNFEQPWARQSPRDAPYSMPSPGRRQDPSVPFVVARARPYSQPTPMPQPTPQPTPMPQPMPQPTSRPPRPSPPPSRPYAASAPALRISPTTPRDWDAAPEKPYRQRYKANGMRLGTPGEFLTGRAAFLLPLLLAVVGIAMIVVGIFGPTRVQTNAAPPATVPAAPMGSIPLSLPASAIRCPQLGSWSEDAQHIALLGTPRTCTAQPGTSGNLVIFDAPTGKAVKTYALTPMILPTAVPANVRNDKTLSADLNLTFTRMLWSPDGYTLAIGYQTSTSVPNTSGKITTTNYGAGLLLLDTVNGTSHIITALTSTGPAATPDQPLQLIRWDVANGTASFIWLPQAAGYTWQGDTLTPIAALTTSTKATGADVAGAGADMGVWAQSGIGLAIPCATTSGTTATNQGPSYLYHASLATWSPDGNVLIYGQWGEARLAATPSSQAASAVRAAGGCTTISVAGLSQLPVLDSGLTQALDALANQPSHPAAAIAWSPDGRYLASVPSTTPSASKAALTIYNTVTGRVASTISTAAIYRVPTGQTPGTPTSSTSAGTAMQPQLLWSPDGRSLLVLDAGHNVATVLEPRALNA